MSDISKLLKAADFAADRHRKQRRKGRKKRPYIGHCTEVAWLIAEVGEVDDVDVLVAAILHDTLEDTKTEPEEIIEAFGDKVNDLVLEVTDDKTLDKEERKKLQVEHAAELSRGAKLIKLADKISNVREIGYDPPKDWDVKRRQKYFGWARQVVDALGPVNTNLEKRFDETLEESSRLLAEEAAGKD